MKTTDRYHYLAIYNSEVSRGLVHTPEYKAVMAKLQEEFNKEMSAKYEEETAKFLSRGTAKWWWRRG